jgi:AraC-like DNA-binding protein
VAMPNRRKRSPVHREPTIQLMAELYIRAQAAVERRYRQPLTLLVLARSLAVSPRQLERAYDEIGLTTFAAHLRAVRLRNAADLLAHQPLTVTDVARLVGYRQPSHFVKAFRRRYGTTPGAFRDGRKASVLVRRPDPRRPRRAQQPLSLPASHAAATWEPITPRTPAARPFRASAAPPVTSQNCCKYAPGAVRATA